MLFLRDFGDTEVGGFGISSAANLFFIEDVRLIRQDATWASVSFHDEAVADFFDEQVDLGRVPEQFSRVWIHTHPGECALPSSPDEETFARAFGGSSWSVMLILSRGNETYARLRFGCGPGGELVVPVDIAWDVPFAATDHEAWEQEYAQCVVPAVPMRFSQNHPGPQTVPIEHPEYFDDWDHLPPYEPEEMERSRDEEWEAR